jgi:hypothetical protein
VKNFCGICFEKFGSLEYNTWTIVPIACLWLVQNVDTTHAHIYYIYNLPNLSKIKFLANLLAGLRGSGVSEIFPEMSGFPRCFGPGPEILGYKGINTFLPQSTGPIHPFYSLTALLSLPVASLSSPSRPWVFFFSHHPNQVRVRD